jgi:hypothetical protein
MSREQSDSFFERLNHYRSIYKKQTQPAWSPLRPRIRGLFTIIDKTRIVWFKVIAGFPV